MRYSLHRFGLENQGVSCVLACLIRATGVWKNLETLAENPYSRSPSPRRLGSFDICPLSEIKDSAVSLPFVRKDINDIKRGRARAKGLAACHAVAVKQRRRKAACRAGALAEAEFDFMRFSEIKNLRGHVRHSGRQDIATVRQNVRQRMAQEPDPLPHGPALQKERTDLVDDCGYFSPLMYSSETIPAS